MRKNIFKFIWISLMIVVLSSCFSYSREETIVPTSKEYLNKGAHNGRSYYYMDIPISTRENIYMSDSEIDNRYRICSYQGFFDGSYAERLSELNKKDKGNDVKKIKLRLPEGNSSAFILSLYDGGRYRDEFLNNVKITLNVNNQNYISMISREGRSSQVYCNPDNKYKTLKYYNYRFVFPTKISSIDGGTLILEYNGYRKAIPLTRDTLLYSK